MTSYLDAGALVTSGLAVGGFYADAMYLGGTTVGVLLGLQTLAFAVGSLVGGRLADRVGRRPVLLGALATYTVGVATLALATGPTGLLLGVVVSGIGIGADLPASVALVGEVAPTGRRGRGIAVVQLFWGVGILVAGLLGLVLAPLDELAARLMFGHLAVVALVVLLLRTGLHETDEWTLARRLPVPVRIEAPAPRGPARAVALAIGAYYLLWLVGANTLGQFKPYLWIELLDGGTRGASLLVLLPIPLGLAGSAVFFLVADSSHRGRWVVLGVLSTLSGWALLLAAPSREAFVVLVALSAVGTTLAGETVYKLWIAELVPTLSRATVQGVTTAVARVAAAGFAFVTPLLLSVGASVLFAVVLVTQLLAAGVALVWVPRLVRAALTPAGSSSPGRSAAGRSGPAGGGVARRPGSPR